MKPTHVHQILIRVYRSVFFSLILTLKKLSLIYTYTIQFFDLMMIYNLKKIK